MKALTAVGYGPPERYVISNILVPEPGAGQIQVRITAASINHGDVVLPSGTYRDVTPLEFPHVPGNDFAGTVTEAGPGVTRFAVGDEVFGQAVPRVLRTMAGATKPSLSTGSLAEYAVFEADTPLLTHRPPNVTPEQAAALATAGLTARALLLTRDRTRRTRAGRRATGGSAPLVPCWRPAHTSSPPPPPRTPICCAGSARRRSSATATRTRASDRSTGSPRRSSRAGGC
ncbi:alcohol dehydrogenase catalytic domain-containing protein [Lentzea guizhouensis]|uniref:alcohol dehydrogenase catalytic domain-containing protein n=1 Tax=Lentzea guizhouensis TaxID=1586287 RepID=UPI000AE499C9|nr:alcohol dehydrogenase catalytic domain-containing protein [Lentzea guizhouensis]